MAARNSGTRMVCRGHRQPPHGVLGVCALGVASRPTVALTARKLDVRDSCQSLTLRKWVKPAMAVDACASEGA